MNKLFLLLVLLVFNLSYSQVGINTTLPNAQLDITSSNQATPTTTDGILIPKIDAFPATNPTSAQNSMMVYLTTTASGKPPGFYYWDNATTSWLGIGGKSGWDIKGNTGTNAATNFIGTTDNNDVVFKRDNIKAGRIELLNTSFGQNSFSALNTGVNNTAIGENTLSSNTNGAYNTAIGSSTLTANTIGNRNTAVGINAMISNVDGFQNTATGTNALRNNVNGNYNTSDGIYSMYNNIDGNENTATGDSALQGNTHGSYNTAVGESALYTSVSGINNTAVGAYALSNGLLTGINNSALGGGALNTATGSDNTGLGYHAGINITSGSNNLAIGSNALVQNPIASNQLSIANVVYGTGMSSALSGKIGVGISNPSSKLHVMNNSSGLTTNPSSVLTVENNDNTYLSLLSSAESGLLFGGNGNSTNGAITYNTPGYLNAMAFRTNNNINRMIISSAGNVAIGAFIPNFPLHFDALLGDKISLYGGPGNHYGFGIQPGLLQMYSDAATTDIAFGYGSSTAFTENVRMKGNGNVGINKPAPAYKLDINETAASRATVLNVTQSNPTAGAQSAVITSNIDSGALATGTIVGSNNQVIANNGVSGRGVYNTISGTSNAGVYGVNNIITLTGAASQYGILSNFNAGTGDVYGVYNGITTSSAALQYGIRTDFSGTAAAYSTGVSNQFFDSGNGDKTGVTNIIASSGSGLQFGLSSNFTGNGSGNRWGVLSQFSGSGNGAIWGSSNVVSSSGNGLHYGTYTSLSGTGSSNKYGEYITIATSAGGTHYGIYSDVLKTNSFAGYFLGNVAIGTTFLNNYIFPSSRGSNNQIMQTDAVGNVTWKDPNTALNSFAWTTTGNSGTAVATNFIGTTDNVDLSIKTNNTEAIRVTSSGNVGIGAAIPTAQLEVNGYTKLGSNAPAIKYLKLTGTTATIQGNSVNFLHGVNSAKILAINVLVDYSVGSSVPPSYNGSAGYEYDYFTTATQIVIWNKSGNSANILSKPVRILITYEQ